METTGKSCRAPLPPTQALQGVIDSQLALGKVSEHFKPLTCAIAHPRPLSELYFHSRREIILVSSGLFPAVIYTSTAMTHSETVNSSVISWFLNHHIFSPLPAHRAAGNVTVRDRQLHFLFNSPPDQLLLIRFLTPDCTFQVLLLRGQHNSQPHCTWERTQASPAALGDLRKAL